MFLEASRARRAIARNFYRLNYVIGHKEWQAICMGIKRDLQARNLRPNVPIPSRRSIIPFIRTMWRETGSLPRAIGAIFHDGPWTSSGGSFRLAETIGVNLESLARGIHEEKGRLIYLEIGGGWAGFKVGTPLTAAGDLAGLAGAFENELGQSVFLHFTNLTKWHSDLPRGVVEHYHVTAAGLEILQEEGVKPGTVDVIYSQAAAYFEPDHSSFLRAAAVLLAPGGTMIFNHRGDLAATIDAVAESHGLSLKDRVELGGMNGIVSHYSKSEIRNAPALQMDRHYTTGRARLAVGKFVHL